MSSYMLIHGDCMDSFGLIHDHSVNLVLADPPYGITQNTWDVVLPFDDFIECDGKNLNYEKYLLHCFKKNIPYKDANEEWNKRKQQGIWSQLDRILADRGVVILFSAGIYTKTLMESTTIPWRYNLIWQKTTPVGFLNANRMPLRAHEDAYILIIILIYSALIDFAKNNMPDVKLSKTDAFYDKNLKNTFKKVIKTMLTEYNELKNMSEFEFEEWFTNQMYTMLTI